MARLLRSCCPCWRRGPGIIERFHHAQEKKKAAVDKETKGLLSDVYGIDEDVEGGEEGADAVELQGPITSDRIQALLDRQVALTSEIENEFVGDHDEDDDDDEGDTGAVAGAMGDDEDDDDDNGDDDENDGAAVEVQRPPSSAVGTTSTSTT
mmetsp:Transcript_10305/g.26800  ORF Transcript_10305/g.26800 Transcript_10305/m.26800 type:complete len:152 (-) Transcript_10305:88-543(-)